MNYDDLIFQHWMNECAYFSIINTLSCLSHWRVMDPYHRYQVPVHT